MSARDGKDFYLFLCQPPKHLSCSVCYFLNQNLHLSACCGYNFCKSCLVMLKGQGRKVECPLCLQVQFNTYPNKEASKEFKNLRIFCPNKERGCQWQQKISDVYDHLGNPTGCQYQDVLCPKGCGKTMRRHYLSSHLS